jgi:creatinine deaminase
LCQSNDGSAARPCVWTHFSKRPWTKQERAWPQVEFPSAPCWCAIGRGHNQRIQKGSVIHHGEMNCLENAGRQRASVYRRCTIYTTLSPCPMCSGAILLYAIPHVVVGESVTFKGAEDHLRAHGVKVDVAQNPDCIQLMRDFITKNPELWEEDIGV